tara:strand:+ start:1816 stop:3063 length:1248 start_codon:yes stop_codon:yes gene_type:complete
MKKILISLFVLLLCLLYDPRISIGVNINISEIISSFLIIYFLFKPKKNGLISILNKKFFNIFLVLFSFYLLIMTLSILDNASFQAVLGRFRNLFYAPLLFFVGLNFPRDQIHNFFKIFKIFIILSVLIGIFNLFFPIEILLYDTEEAYQMITNQKVASISILGFVFCILNIYLKKSSFSDYLIILLLVLSVIGSQNRSLIIIYISSFLWMTYLLLKERQFSTTFIFRFSLLAIILIISFNYFLKFDFIENYIYRYQKISQELTGTEDFSQSQFMTRIGRSISTFYIFIKNPFLGSGWDYEFLVLKIFDFNGNYIRTAYGTPHNYFVNQLLQTGIIGFSIMMYFFIKVYKLIKPIFKLNKENILNYSFFTFFFMILLFNTFNVYLYGSPAYIALTFFLFGLGISFNLKIINKDDNR